MKQTKELTLKISALPVALSALTTSSQALAQDAPDLGKLADFIRWGGVFLSIIVILGSIVLRKLISGIAERLSLRFSNQRPTIQKFESMAHFALYIVTATVCVTLSIRLDPTALTVIGGALAFAIGFAMRDLVAAFIAGIMIMFDRPFQVGDRVSYAGEYGDIIKIGLRSVQMNTLDHNIVTIPNNKILTDVTSSGNYGALEIQVALDFYIGLDQDTDAATDVIREACLTSPFIFLEKPIPISVKQTLVKDYIAIHLKARHYVFDCQYEKQFESDVHLRVLKAFRERGILPPAILHRTLTTKASTSTLNR